MFYAVHCVIIIIIIIIYFCMLLTNYSTCIIKVLFIHQLMRYWVVLKKNNIKIYLKIYIETAPTCFGVTVYTIIFSKHELMRSLMVV